MNQLVNATDKRCTLVKKASQVYGYDSIVDTSFEDEENIGSWNALNVNRLSIIGIVGLNHYPIASSHLLFLNTAFVSQLGTEKSEWYSKKEPFTQENLLDNLENQVQEIIFRIKTTSVVRHCESIANKLFALYQDAKEEDPNCIGISIGSLSNFQLFLMLNENLKCPTISLTSDYNVYVSWKDKEERLFSAHFLSNGDVRFVIFKPNKKHPKLKIRLSGSASSDVLIDEVGDVKDWIFE